MKRILLALCISISVFSHAQSNTFSSLEKLKSKHSWLKVYKKADKLTEKKFKKESVPYFYKAEALLKITKDPKLSGKVDRSFKECLKAVEKAVLYDLNNKAQSRFTKFNDEFNTYASELAQSYFEDEKYNKAKPIYEALSLLNLKDLNYTLRKGLCDINSGNEESGYADLSFVIHSLKDSIFLMETNIDSNVRTGFLMMTNHLLYKAEMDSAYGVIDLGTDLFEGDKDLIEKQYIVTKNHRLFYNHYNKYTDALKLCVKAANKFPNESKFIDLEIASMVQFTDVQIIYAKYDFIESIWTKYTGRKRDPDLRKNLNQTNKALIDLIVEYHHLGQAKISKELMSVLYNINKNIEEKINIKKTLTLKEWGIDICDQLSKDGEYYLAYTSSRYIKMYLPDDKDINELSGAIRAKLNDYKLTLSGQADQYLNAQEVNVQKYISLLEGFIKVKSFEKAYAIYRKASKAFPENSKLKELQRKIIIDDYIINFEGSKVTKNYVDGQIINELSWTGNTKKCLEGSVSETAHNKTMQRINYFRRFAGIDDEIKFTLDLNKKAQKIAFELYSDSMDCKISNLAETTPGIKSDGKHTSYAVYDMMKGTHEIGQRHFILNPDYKYLGHGSTDQNMTLILDDKMPEHNERFDSTFIAWPSEGMVPAELVFARWSFSLPNADFSKAKVEMRVKEFNRPIPEQMIRIDEFDPSAPGVSTFSWIPLDVILYAQMDLTYEVHIYNVKFPGDEQGYGFKYDVTVIQTK